MGTMAWKVILDFIILAVIGFPLLALMLWVEPYHRGFFLDDHTIRLPFKKQTVTEEALAGVGFALIIATVIIVEVIRNKKGKGLGEKFLSSTLVPGWLWESYVTIGIYTFGGSCQQLTCNLAKYSIGRLRPHFYDVCQPLVNLTSPLNENAFVQEYTCQGTDDADRLKNMRLSFPSAHASYAMYTAVFFILYIQVKGKWRGSKLLRHAFQLAAFMGAWYVGLSRVVDHMHHWGDVAVGFFVGATYGVLVFVFVLKPKGYNPSPWPQEPPMPDNMLPRPVLAPQAR